MKRSVFALLALSLVLFAGLASAKSSGYQSYNVAGRGGARWQGVSPTWISGLTLWLRADQGVTSVIGPVTATGTAPPTVTLSGTTSTTQTSAATPYVELDCTLGGALGVAQFTAKVNGVTTMTGVATSASVGITGSGLTASWAAGVSTNNDVYTSNIVAMTWADQSGNGNNPTQATASRQPIYTAAIPSASAKLTFATASSQDLVSSQSAIGATGWTIAQVAQYNVGCNTTACYGAAFGTATNGNAFKVNTAPLRDLTARGVVDRNDGPPTTSIESWIGTNDSITTRLYINGGAVTLTNATTNAVSSGAAVTIGADETGATFLSGSMFEVAAWTRVLDSSEIWRLATYESITH